MAIASFARTAVQAFFSDGTVPRGAGWAGAAAVVGRKLDMIDYAHDIEDLRSPPGNRLEKLAGNLRGFHSIRVNRQWRVVFRWTSLGAEEVDVVDYH